MNLKNSLNEKEIKLLENAGINVEDREYSEQELERCAFYIQDYIMSHSLKNGDINKVSDKYEEILNRLL